MKISPYGALLSAVLLAPGAAAQNLLSNADFEAGLTGWTSFGNAFASSTNPPEIMPLSGSQVCKLYGLFGPGFDVSGIFQSFPANPGEQFQIDAWSRHWSGDPLTGGGPPADNWVVMKMAFFDAGNAEIGGAEATIVDGTSPTDTWIDNTPVIGTAPPGTVSVQALILFLQPGTAGGAAQVDDVSFESYTPPTTGNLLSNPDFESGLGGWGAFGNVFAESNNPPEIVPLSGTQVCKMFGLFGPGFDVSGIFQSFPAVPGESFLIDAWSRHWSGDQLTGGGPPNDNWVVMKIAFFDVGGAEIGGAEGTILDGNSPTNIWIDNAPVIGTAPAGTASVQALILFLQPFTAGGAGQVEDVLFEQVTLASETARQAVPSNPGTLLPGQTSGPVVGQTWDPVIQPFLPGAGLDVLVLTFPSNNNLPGPSPVVGNILVDLNTVLLNQITLPGSPFAIPIPNVPGAAGLALSTQGASFGPTTVGLTNAIDIVIGY